MMKRAHIFSTSIHYLPDGGCIKLDIIIIELVTATASHDAVHNEGMVGDNHILLALVEADTRVVDYRQQVPPRTSSNVDRRGAAVLQHLAVPWFYLQKEDFDLDVKGSSYS